MHYSDADIPSLLRPRKHSKPALAMLSLVVVLLVALTGAVFTISATATDNRDRTELVAAADDAIRDADEVRATTLAVLLGGAAAADLDATHDTLRSTHDVATALGIAEDLTPRLDAYIDSSREFAALAPDVTVDDLNAAHRDYVEPLDAARRSALGDARAAEDLLGRLTTGATAIAAFLLPTMAILMYALMTRRRRETTELAEDLVATRTAVSRSGAVLELTSDRVAGAIEVASERVAALEADDEELSGALISAMRDADDLDALVRFSRSGCVHELGPTSLLDILTDARDDLRLEQLELTAIGRDESIWGDPHTATHAIRTLLWLAQQAEPERLVATTGTDDRWVHCLITYSGDPLDASLVRSLFDERISDDVWEAMHDSRGLALAVARTLLETAGARIVYRSKANANQFHLRFPSPQAPHLATAQVPEAAADEAEPVPSA